MSQNEKIKRIIKSIINGMLPVHTAERMADIIATELIKKGVTVPDEL